MIAPTIKVVGIDPGSGIVGFGVVTTPVNGRGAKLVECGVLRLGRHGTLPDRLRAIHDGLGELFERHRPDVLAVEDIFYARNVRTTAVLGHARGVILLAGSLAGVPVYEYTPTRIKKAITGLGSAPKSRIAYMVAKLLSLAGPPKPADAADGVAVALAHVLLSSRPLRRAIL